MTRLVPSQVRLKEKEWAHAAELAERVLHLQPPSPLPRAKVDLKHLHAPLMHLPCSFSSIVCFTPHPHPYLHPTTT